MQTSHTLLQHVGGIDENNLNTILQHLGRNDEPDHSYPTSYYVDTDAFVSQIPKSESVFSMLTLNIQCLSAKFDKLCAFLQELSNANIHFSAIAIQETWLPENFNYALYDIPGYNAISQGYICGKKGGLIIYLQEKFTYSQRNIYTPSKHWESLIIDVMHDDLLKKITLANIYRPPRENNSNRSIDNFLEPMASIIEILSRENSTLLCGGDFNIDMLKLEEREKFQQYFDMFVQKGVIPQITLPTRFSKKKCHFNRPNILQ